MINLLPDRVTSHDMSFSRRRNITFTLSESFESNYRIKLDINNIRDSSADVCQRTADDLVRYVIKNGDFLCRISLRKMFAEEDFVSNTANRSVYMRLRVR